MDSAKHCITSSRDTIIDTLASNIDAIFKYMKAL